MSHSDDFFSSKEFYYSNTDNTKIENANETALEKIELWNACILNDEGIQALQLMKEPYVLIISTPDPREHLSFLQEFDDVTLKPIIWSTVGLQDFVKYETHSVNAGVFDSQAFFDREVHVPTVEEMMQCTSRHSVKKLSSKIDEIKINDPMSREKVRMVPYTIVPPALVKNFATMQGLIRYQTEDTETKRSDWFVDFVADIKVFVSKYCYNASSIIAFQQILLFAWMISDNSYYANSDRLNNHDYHTFDWNEKNEKKRKYYSKLNMWDTVIERLKRQQQFTWDLIEGDKLVELFEDEVKRRESRHNAI